MIRVTVVLVGLAASAFAALADEKDEKDPIKEKLFAAKVAFDKEMSAYRKAAEDWFDKREEAARKAGDKKVIDAVKAERKVFDEDDVLPKTAPTAIVQKPATARKALEAAYAEAIKAYTQAKKDDLAAAVDAEFKRFALASAATIDLLALVNLKVHKIDGVWEMDGSTLVGTGKAKEYGRLQLPYAPGEEYDIKVGCKRLKGDGAVVVGLVAGGKQVGAVIDNAPKNGYRSGLSLVDGKGAISKDNTTTVQGAMLKAGVYNSIFCSVRAGKIEMTVNEKPAGSFKGDFDRLSLPEQWEVPNKKTVFLVIPSGSFQFDSIVVTPVKGKGTVLK